MMMDRKDTPDTVPPQSLASSSSSFSSLNSLELLIQDIAKNGNGIDEDLSKEQIYMIFELYENVQQKMEQLQQNHHPNHHDWFVNDIDVCRRYLVARQWNIQAAQIQLESTIDWRLKNSDLLELQFSQSPKAYQNPWSLAMRPIGYDSIEGRPICFTSFAESSDRWDPDSNIAHMILLMEACCNMIYERRRKGSDNNNQTASSRQWIFVIDFDGFNVRDASNPKSGILTAKVLQHYPELLNMVVLINAPFLFSGMFSLIKPFIDDRVKSKIVFVKGKRKDEIFNEQICSRLGNDAVTWIWDEIQDNYNRRKDKNPKKQYWLPPPSNDDDDDNDSNQQGRQQQHDSRGMKSYVESEFYVKTPGDAYLEKQKQNQTTTTTSTK